MTTEKTCCVTCPEHPSEMGGDLPHEQCHSSEDHVGDSICMCSTYYDPLNDIMDYEGGEASVAQVFRLFSHLIETGKCWTLQGHYGRVADSMMQNGIFDASGKLTDKGQEILDEAN